jgi:5-methylthioribose kinase
MSRAEFERRCPGVFFLEAGGGEGLAEYLRGIGVLAANEPVLGAQKAGEGNMNCAVRVRTDRRRVIVKQSRPWVEKYPQFEAPWDRALVEGEFYRMVAAHPAIGRRMPRLLASDSRARVLVFEDLGPSADLTSLYGGVVLEERAQDELTDYLSALHAAFAGSTGSELLANREMRALNAHHIFFVPLDRALCPDLDSIQPGLAEAAAEVQSDHALRTETERLGHEAYLADGPCLLHGDFFPGSILSSEAGLKVIDPEFAFFGRAEFDGGVWLAHLALAGQPASLTRRFLERYQPPAGFETSLLLKLAGVEIIRRLIGFAQLPLVRDLPTKADLLSRGRELALRPDPRWLTC